MKIMRKTEVIPGSEFDSGTTTKSESEFETSVPVSVVSEQAVPVSACGIGSEIGSVIRSDIESESELRSANRRITQNKVTDQYGTNTTSCLIWKQPPINLNDTKIIINIIPERVLMKGFSTPKTTLERRVQTRVGS